VNDLTELRCAWEPPDAPATKARQAARAALLAHASREGTGRRGARPPLLRRALRPPRVGARRASLAGVALLTALGGVVAVQNMGGTDDAGRRGVLGVPSASAAVLNQAADVAERQPFVAPRDDQWIYTEDEITGPDGATSTRTTWRRADGGGLATLDERGRLEVHEAPERRPALRPVPFDTYKGAAALPADPDRLLRWAYATTASVTGAGSTRDAEAFSILRVILDQGVVRPELGAAAFRAMAKIPGVRVRTTEIEGAPTLAVGQTDVWLDQELLLDADTYEYRGQRSTVVRDARIDPEKAGNKTGKVERGETATLLRVVAGLVDEPGTRP
jgi:hypothetical protein